MEIESWIFGERTTFIKSIYFHNLYKSKLKKKEFQSVTVRIQERVATDSTGVLTNLVSSKSCSCCFVAQASKPEPKLPAGDFHGGVGRRDASFGPCVRLLRWLKGFLLCSRLTHVKLKATLHSHYITYHLGPPPRIHMAFRAIWGHVILQLAQWSGVSAPSSSLSLCAPRLTRSKSIKAWGFWI